MPPQIRDTLPLCLIALTPSTLTASDLEHPPTQPLANHDEATPALEQHAAQPENAQHSFWRARAHLARGEMQQAASLLASIPSTDTLYPYAVKHAIYIAQQQGENALEPLLEQLSKSPHPQSRQRAQLLQLEQAIKQSQVAKAEGLTETLQKETLPSELKMQLELASIDLLRLKGHYQQALDYGRQLESGEMGKITPDLRARIRLKLADIYYSQAKHGSSKERDVARGRGEETLLGFVSAHPESPLISDAFLKLAQQRVFEESTPAFKRLKEWIEPDQLSKGTRAAHALKTLFQLEDPRDTESNLSYVKKALASFPRHPASQYILHEAARRLLEQGDLALAKQYIKLIDEEEPYRKFFDAQLLAHDGDFRQACELFYQTSQANPHLRDTALANASLCALRSGQEERALELSQQIISPKVRVRLLSNQIAHYTHLNPARAQGLAHQLLKQYPDSAESINASMDLIQLQVSNTPLEAKKLLSRLQQADKSRWTEAQIERLHALSIWCAKQLYRPDEDKDDHNPLYVIEDALKQDPSPKVKAYLTLHLGEILMEQQKYEQALEIYQDFADQETDDERSALGYLLAARSAEKLETLPSLKHAIHLYKQCAKQVSSYRIEGLIGAATLCIRLGREVEARELISPLLDKEKELSAPQRSLLHTLMAQAWAYDAMKMPTLISLVLKHSSTMLDSDELPPTWLIRARLHHAHLCSRFGQRYEAIESYQAVLDQLQHSSTLNHADWYFYNHAASGKIIQLLKLTQYRAAARCADELADWVRNHLKAQNSEPDMQQQEIINSLRKRAMTIRQSNFLISQPEKGA